MIDKFIGDAVMAVWGVPIPNTRHAELGCCAALEIADHIRSLVEEEVALTRAEISVRMGINSGEVVAGNIGGSKHFDYTVLGNQVNLASRLEGVNKIFGTQIMVGENTAKLAGADFVLYELDEVRVKGKEQAVTIFELQGERIDGIGSAQNKFFTEGFGLYKQRHWAGAMQAFESELDFSDGDAPSAVYIDRCKSFLKVPPPNDWDGVFDITTK